MNLTPLSEINQRVYRLQQELQGQELDGALLVLNSDLFYFSGTVQNAFLFIPAAGEPALLVKKSLSRAQAESPLQNILSLRSPKEIPALLAGLGHHRLSRIGLELDVLPVNLFQFYSSIFPGTAFSDITPAVKGVRAVKSSYEISLLGNALAVLDQAFRAVPSILRVGMAEIELAALFEAEMRRRGYSACCKMRAFNQNFFFGNACAGESAVCPSFFDGPVGGSGVSVSHPQGAGWRQIKPNEPVYLDYTCVIDGYTGDQTRIFCLGQLSPRMIRAFQDTLILQEEMLKVIRPGAPAEAAHIRGLQLAAEMGYSDHFMGLGQDQVKFVGHGIGLELDEWPILAKGIKTPLLPGMTFALEPKLIFPEGAVGIENSYVLREEGPDRLSLTPDELICL